ncbi:MAG: DNA repair protein RadC [Parachlamydiaceae bacterium]|nr:DNA repair protein RadC [Parachlamydiaceae bacterium]
MTALDPIGYSVLSLPAEDRPRERLQRFGPEAMSTAELVAVLLGSGTKGNPVLQLAHELIVRFGNLKGLSEATVAELCQIKGLGQAKAIQLKAAFSLGVRLAKQPLGCRYRIENPMHAYNLVKDELSTEKREVFMTILLDTKGYVINHEVIAIGTLSQTLVHPREVFYPAIRHKAASLILVHNHPSGDPTPSKEDYEVTTKLSQAGAMISIPIHDHIILGQNQYISLRQKGFNF